MVASKTSILVAAVALGAASVYTAPAPLNKDISLSRRHADDSALIAREFDDDELYAREFFDELDARDFEDDALEVRNFDEDELFARELYEDELEARAFDEAGEFEGVPFKPFPTTTPSSTPTPSSTATSSASTSIDAAKEKHVLAATSPSALNSGKKHHNHRICKPYKKAYEMLTGVKLSKGKVGEHKVDAHVHAHNVHEQDHHQLEHPKQPEHPKHPKHGSKRHHQASAEEIAQECGPEIAALLAAVHHQHKQDAAIDASTAHSTALTFQTPETLNVVTPTKAKRGLTQLWARVVGAGQGYPDAAGPVSAESSLSAPPPEGAENLATTRAPDGEQGPLNPKKPHRHNCRQHPQSKWCRSHHQHKRPHHRKTKQGGPGAALDSTKSVTDANVNGGRASDAGSPDAVARVMRRSLEDEIWERGLANSLGLDEDYFTKRFYDEDAFEF